MTVEFASLLQDMVRIDSRNTLPLKSDGAREADEEKMAAYLAAFLEERGFAVQRQYAAPKRPNLIGYLHRHDSYPTLAFEAHMDTVGTAGMTMQNPLSGAIENGRLYGRGACDTKASAAAMLAVLDDLRQSDIPLNLMFIGSCSEETGCEGVVHVDLSPWRIDGIIVGEPTSNIPVVRHKAHAAVEFICRGKAAHGAMPGAGINAVYRMMAFVEFMKNDIESELALDCTENFPSGATLSVNMISGGVKSNIVPDLCRTTVDFRLLPTTQEISPFVNDILRRAREKLGFEVELGQHHFTAGFETAPEHPLVAALADAAEQLKEMPVECGTVHYCTDAGVLAQKGFASVVFGPGSILQAHGAEEYIELDEVAESIEILKLAAHNFAAAKNAVEHR